MKRTHILWLSVAAWVSWAVVWSASADILHVPGDFPTIQAAIDAAVDGDEVEVHSGTYNEAIDFLGKAIRVYSTDGPDMTIIDAQQTGSVVTCDSAEGPDSVLEGFTITGGNANVGGGMYNDSSSPTVTNCTFSGNTATNGGGGMDNYFSSPTVTNCTFSGNTATNVGGGILNFSSSPTVTNCTFSGNTANGGGGMYNYLSSPTVTNCSFSGNTATYGGGGIFNYSSSPTVTNCTFSENSAATGGGMVNGFGTPTVIDCTFSGNSAVGGGGGGMYNECSSPTVIDCTFSGNSAFFGGGMSNREATSMTVTNCTFSGNTAQFGGGMVNIGSSTTVTNCTFIGNSADDGGGMFNADGSSPTVTNCTFSGNTADFGGGGMYNFQTTPTVTNCVLWNDSPDEIFNVNGTAFVSFSDVQGGYPGEGNIDADPLFVDPDNGDLRPLPGSPCIDAADNSAVPKGIDTDLDGNPRFVDDPVTKDTGLGDCLIVDMGSYEFQDGTTDCCPWDLDDSGDVGVKDLLFLLGAWGPCPPKGDCPADFDGSGDVGVKDLLILLGNWGPCP